MGKLFDRVRKYDANSGKSSFYFRISIPIAFWLYRWRNKLAPGHYKGKR